jgi:hypothetical protein
MDWCATLNIVRRAKCEAEASNEKAAETVAAAGGDTAEDDPVDAVSVDAVPAVQLVPEEVIIHFARIVIMRSLSPHLFTRKPLRLPSFLGPGQEWSTGQFA